jgi:hypothetical protein
MRMLVDLALRLDPQPSATTVFLGRLLIAAVATALSWMTSRGVQRLAGRRSRWILGA